MKTRAGFKSDLKIVLYLGSHISYYYMGSMGMVAFVISLLLQEFYKLAAQLLSTAFVSGIIYNYIKYKLKWKI